MHPRITFTIEFYKSGVLRVLSANARPGDYGRAVAEPTGERKTRLRDCFTGGHNCQLREAIQKLGLQGVLLGIEAANFGSILELEIGGIDCRNWSDARASGLQCVPVLRHVSAKRRDHAESGDDDATHRSGSLLLGYKRRYAVDHLSHVLDLARLVVGNGNIELTFELEQDIYGVERVEAQLLEGAVDRDLIGGNSFLLVDDFEDLAGDRIFRQTLTSEASLSHSGEHVIWLATKRKT